MAVAQVPLVNKVVVGAASQELSSLHQLYDYFMICPVAFTGALKSWNPAVQDEEARLSVHSFIHFLRPWICVYLPGPCSCQAPWVISSPLVYKEPPTFPVALFTFQRTVGDGESWPWGERRKEAQRSPVWRVNLHVATGQWA